MNAKYGATDVNGKIVEDMTTSSTIEHSNLSVPCRLRWWRISQNVLYGLGHVYNDLCAAMWFSYMMLFLQAVLGMKAAIAGAMLLLGQVIDALATPVVGILADKYSTKKSWHLAGCTLVTSTFPLLFVRCWGCWVTNNPSYLQWWMPFYYAVLITFFQIGWAIVQISHLAMIPAISDNLQVRSELTSIRYMASVVSSLAVYLITWVVLRATKYSTSIGPLDDYKFRELGTVTPLQFMVIIVQSQNMLPLSKGQNKSLGSHVDRAGLSKISSGFAWRTQYHKMGTRSLEEDVSLIISGIGVLSFAIFHIFFKLRSYDDQKIYISNGTLSNEDNEAFKLPAKSKLKYFLQMPMLYQTSLLYVFSRLYWALSLIYVPLFLEERLSVNPTEGSELVASVPLVLYISSFFFSLLLKRKMTSRGHQISYLVGSFLSLISCLWIALAIDPQASIIQIYLVATLIGAGSSITLVSSLCVTADMIGPHAHQGATVYSIVTFADKLVTGIAVVTIENYKCDDVVNCPQYYRGVLTYACGGSVLLGILSLSFTKLSSMRKPEA